MYLILKSMFWEIVIVREAVVKPHQQQSLTLLVQTKGEAPPGVNGLIDLIRFDDSSLLVYNVASTKRAFGVNREVNLAVPRWQSETVKIWVTDEKPGG